MRSGLLIPIFTSCALASLMFQNAKVGDRVELYLGNVTTWCRDSGKGERTCAPFPNSTVQSNGSLVFESVQLSDSGTYYSLEGAQKKLYREPNDGIMTLVANPEIVLNVTRA